MSAIEQIWLLLKTLAFILSVLLILQVFWRYIRFAQAEREARAFLQRAQSAPLDPTAGRHEHEDVLDTLHREEGEHERVVYNIPSARKLSPSLQQTLVAKSQALITLEHKYDVKQSFWGPLFDRISWGFQLVRGELLVAAIGSYLALAGWVLFKDTEAVFSAVGLGLTLLGIFVTISTIQEGAGSE
jgi:hypothetical protein